MPTTPSTRKLLLLLLAAVFSLPAHTQTPGTPAPQPHPWEVPTPRLEAEAYFTNLQDGDKIETPYLLKFGLSGGWGLAPISSSARTKSGHHHLLINRDLPLNFKQALPFNEQYIHFGKGQMETVLNLAPGTYTLRMLLADQNHLPHFVYSKPASITVTKKNATDPKLLAVKGISVAVSGGAEVRRPFRVQFHASALNVAHQSQQEKDTGHFRLTVIPRSGGTPAVMSFNQGQTETWLSPPVGNYDLKLELLDNLNPGQTLTAAVNTSVTVR